LPSAEQHAPGALPHQSIQVQLEGILLRLVGSDYPQHAAYLSLAASQPPLVFDNQEGTPRSSPPRRSTTSGYIPLTSAGRRRPTGNPQLPDDHSSRPRAARSPSVADTRLRTTVNGCFRADVPSTRWAAKWAVTGWSLLDLGNERAAVARWATAARALPSDLHPVEGHDGACGRGVLCAGDGQG
jgi:hypothetical protein